MTGPARRHLLGALALAALLSLAVAMLPPPPGQVIPEPPDRVRSITVTAEGRSVQVIRSGATWRAQAPSQVVAEASGPGFRGLASPEEGVEVADRTEWVLDQICERAPVRALPSEAVVGEEFGLAEPAVRLTILADHTYHLEIGALNPTGDGRYFRMPGRDRAGLIGRDVAGEITALAGAGGPEH